MRRKVLVALALITFLCSAVVAGSVVTEVATGSTPTAEAAYWWENWTGYIVVNGQGWVASQGFIQAHDPHWIDQPWGWTSPPWKAKLMLKYCTYSSYYQRYEMHVWSAPAWLNEHVNGSKWADQAGDWVSMLTDITPGTQSYCQARMLAGMPYYF